MGMMTDNPTNHNIKSWAEDERPRERMLQKGYAALSDVELLAILIQSGTKEKSAVDLARSIMHLGKNNLSALSRLGIKDLQSVKGIGKARAISIVAALELGRRRQIAESLQKKKISSSKDAEEILVPLLSDVNQERFVVMYLSISNKLLHYELLSSGGTTSTVVELKMIFRSAILHLASRIIVAHNHPSGQLKPSHADKQLTQRIAETGKLMDVQLVDHLIIGDNQYFSFADEGLI